LKAHRLFWLFLLFALSFGRAAERPTIVFIAGEYEYNSRETLPAFAAELSRSTAAKTIVLKRPDDPKLETIPGLEALEDADLVILLVRRMTLPEEQLGRIRKYIDSGKPLIGLRTASHAFQNWKEFDAEVLGGNYQNHYGNTLKTAVSVHPETRDHPILNGVKEFASDGSLYKNTPLRPGAKPLLMGHIQGHPAEPIAWTREDKGRRVFYTSLGHPNDFKEESFRKLLRNGIDWALNKPLSKTSDK
jgi:type 1 glutamine amidotransferase